MKTKLFPLCRVSCVVFLLALCSAPFALSQVPQGFNYQAIARDGVTGNPITDLIDVKIAILSDDDPETVVWEELHEEVDPDDHGLFSIVVGSGACQTAPTYFTDIDWTVDPLFIRTQIYYDGEWKNMGSAQLQSVPYAMLADNVETKQTLSLVGSDLSISGGNTVTLPTGGSLWTANGGDVYRPTGNVGIGTSTPQNSLEIIGGTVIRNPSASEYSTLRLYNDQNLNVRSLEIDYTGSSYSGGGEYGLIYTTGAYPLHLGAGGGPRLTISNNGNVGIGTISPSSKLHIFSPDGSLANLFATGSSQGSALMYVGQSTMYGGGIAYDGQGTPDIVGGYDRITFFRRNNGTDNEVFSYGFWNNTVDYSGSINVSEQIKVGPNAGISDEVPLFEVKNKYGIAVLAVYNNGVKINIEHDPDGIKGPKGGFAIGGYDYTKGGTVTLMNVTPDSIRFNINNDNLKGPKGGFAIGGYDYTKGDINEDFMYITPQTSDNGQYNTFMGYQSGFNNLSTGIRNTFFGHQAGYGNTSGDRNVFIGVSSGQQELGYDNVYLGVNAGSKIPQPPLYLAFDASNENVIIGVNAGQYNEGDYNVIIGKEAGKVNDADGQVFLGWGAGKRNTTGNANTFLGGAAGEYNTTGIENTGVGLGALCNSTGNYNTALGCNAGSGVTSGGNNITIGTNSMVPSATGNDQVRIGNTFIVYAGIQVAWTVTSDIRWKESIEDLSLGLNVINGLKPVDYIRKNNTLRTREAGFIAQDVEKLFNELGIENTGLLSKGYDGSLELRYNDFIPILTKAIQEQQAQIESQNQENQQLKSELQSIKDELKQIKEMVEEIASSSR